MKQNHTNLNMKTINKLMPCALLTLALAFNHATQAGAILGPKDTNERTRAFANDVYSITFRGGEAASVFVVGDHDTDLDVRIYDEFGTLVSADLDSSDVCLCRWYPKWTGAYRIEVRNLSSVYNRYSIETN